MSSQSSHSSDETAVSDLYRQVLDLWNRRDANNLAALFEEDGNMVGFDGSQINGRKEISSVIGQIFAEHQTPPFFGKIREVRFLTPEVAIVRAVAGMPSPGESELNPALNAIQTLVTVKRDGKWKAALFQNTPAQFHGRPELSEALTEELRKLL